ncbi:MAG: hypothetical protein JWM33_1174 [Caulobacteraceae bacterium]|nr:hypothetical protein [Caulobacteraceae bacterium]
MTLADSKLQALSALITMAPDDLLRALATADDPAMLPVRVKAALEWEGRRRRDQVLSPIRELYSKSIRNALWRAAGITCADLRDQALSVNLQLETEPTVFDDLCLAIAAGLKAGDESAWQAAAATITAEGVNPADIVSRLELTAIARKAQSQVATWTRRMTGDRIAQVRLAYQDAVAISPDAGPRFFEMLAVGLDEPWSILRIISAAMHGPTEAYLAASELAPFAQAALDDIEACIAYVRRFDPVDGAAAGPAAAAQAARGARGLVEFSAAIRLETGAWSRTIDRQRKALAAAVESRLRELGPLVDKALPRRRTGGKKAGPPDFSNPADKAGVARAAGMVAFADALHACADFGGFTAYRTKVLDALQVSLNSYVEEVLELLRKTPDTPDALQARRQLEIAADLCGLAQGDKAAEIIRRRAAA